MSIRQIRIFPLPGVVLLPGALLPLHIFEPRYRAMVADALSGDKTIGMAMMKPGWEEAGSRPEIFPVGGAGRIVESEQLRDGRYNIVLEGEFRYRVLEEAPPAPYRVAKVAELASEPFARAADAARVCLEASSLFEELAAAMSLPPLPVETLPPERLASELALRLSYEPADLQALLEMDSVPARFETLLERLKEWRGRIRFLAPFRPAAAEPSNN